MELSRELVYFYSFKKMYYETREIQKKKKNHIYIERERALMPTCGMDTIGTHDGCASDMDFTYEKQSTGYNMNRNVAYLLRIRL